MPKEYIEREAALRGVNEFYHEPKIDIVLRKIPTADVVEVVRCKDCKFHTDEEPGMVYCPGILGNWVNDDWYCGDGERRTE